MLDRARVRALTLEHGAERRRHPEHPAFPVLRFPRLKATSATGFSVSGRAATTARKSGASKNPVRALFSWRDSRIDGNEVGRYLGIPHERVVQGQIADLDHRREAPGWRR